LVLLVNFQNDQRQPFTLDQVNNLIFNSSNTSSVTNFYRENSYQQTGITGNVQGYFTLPSTAAIAEEQTFLITPNARSERRNKSFGIRQIYVSLSDDACLQLRRQRNNRRK
jgi:hypothetical protein